MVIDNVSISTRVPVELSVGLYGIKDSRMFVMLLDMLNVRGVISNVIAVIADVILNNEVIVPPVFPSPI